MPKSSLPVIQMCYTGKVQRDVKQHYKILEAIKAEMASWLAELMRKHTLGIVEEGDDQ